MASTLRIVALLIACSVGLHPQENPQQVPQPVPQQVPPSPPVVTPTPLQSPLAMQDLGTRLAARINLIRQADPRAQHAIWGINVVDLATGASLYAENADKLLLPASNTKLFTTATTLALIGPEYRFLTTVESAARPDRQGNLRGDLVLVGRGDPNISGRVMPYSKKTERQTPHTRILEELADQIAAAGVKSISGDIVGDDSYFIYERYAEGWAQDDVMWDYGAPVSALTVNDNVVFTSIKPAMQVGAPALIALDPYVTYYTLHNLVTTSARGTARNIGILREPGSLEITCWGTIPMGDAGDDEALAIEEPATANAQLFRDMLMQRGIVVRGRARARHADAFRYPPPHEDQPLIAPAAPPPARVVLAQHESAPLIQDLQVINKVSQNLHVEMMLRLLGKLRGPSASISGGLDVEKRFLTEQAGLDPNEFLFHDGSGMSRENLVTPHALTQLLIFARSQPWGEAWRTTFPIAAEDGSLSTRFKGTFAADHVDAKTGQLGEVNSLSGYGTTRRGNNIAFSIVLNHHTMGGAKARQMIDDVVNAVLEED